MKYELNTPYEFEVKNVSEYNGVSVFEVEIGGNLFPVKAYPEQLEGDIPHIVSCRIVLDKNKNAFLVQNEAFLYPYIYKPNQRYIFEIIEVKDNHVVLKDKYGLYHSMSKEGTSYSVNEIIVRCVKIIKDQNCRAHLDFYYLDPAQMQKQITEESIINSQETNNTIYPPTLFVQDPPSSSSPRTKSDLQIKESDATVVTHQKDKKSEAVKSRTLSSMMLSKEWDNIRLYLKKNLRGPQIPQIQQEIATTIDQSSSFSFYWDSVCFFLSYDAHMFIGTLAKIDTSSFEGKPYHIDYLLLDDIIRYAFSPSDKLPHALRLLAPCKEILTTKQKNFIQIKCAWLNTSEAFYELFKLLSFSPNDAVFYLLTLQENDAAAYTIYKFYQDGKNGGRLVEESNIETFKPSNILKYCQMMEKTQKLAFRFAAKLIKTSILNMDHFPRYYQREVAKNGYEGFMKIIAREEQRIKS